MASDTPCSVMFYSTSDGGDTKPLLVLVSKGNASSQQRCRHQEGGRYAFMGSVTSWDTWFPPLRGR